MRRKMRAQGGCAVRAGASPQKNKVLRGGLHRRLRRTRALWPKQVDPGFANLHRRFIFWQQNRRMNLSRLPLIIKLFAAIGLTAMLVVVTMALLVASSMRDGFAQYLLKGELVQLDGLVGALAQSHDPQNPGWPAFLNDPRQWSEFAVRYTGPDVRAVAAEPMAPPPPAPLGDRVVLLGADGGYIAGPRVDGALYETRPILAIDAAPNDAPLGWLKLSTPGGVQSETDAFYLHGQFNALILAAVIATALSAIAAYLLARQFLAPIHALEAGARRLAKGNYAARIPNARGDELGRLIAHYNDLAGSLEAAEIRGKAMDFRHQSRIADAACGVAGQYRSDSGWRASTRRAHLARHA